MVQTYEARRWFTETKHCTSANRVCITSLGLAAAIGVPKTIAGRSNGHAAQAALPVPFEAEGGRGRRDQITEGCYQAPEGKVCPDADKIINADECEEAAEYLEGHSWVKVVDTPIRPNGCFHGKSLK